MPGFSGTSLRNVNLTHCYRLEFVGPHIFGSCGKLERVMLPGHRLAVGEWINVLSAGVAERFGGFPDDSRVGWLSKWGSTRRDRCPRGSRGGVRCRQGRLRVRWIACSREMPWVSPRVTFCARSV
jgi:hypothetical protein